MDALELLKQDHEKVADLFEEADDSDDQPQKERIFEKIKTELETHTYIEETVFYPALEKHEDLKELVKEAYEEHRQVKTLLTEITGLVAGSEKFDAKLKVMKENVEHHVEEEENEMFPKVRRVLDDKKLETLGRELAAAKQDGRKRSTTTSRR
jgi:iron-sulfur cluster repair protein YtfE (RIC family)